MQKNLKHFFLLLSGLTAFSCQSGNDEEGKSIASTHPKLEEQLERDSVRTPITSNEKPDLYQRYRITIDEFYADATYQVQNMYRGQLKPVNLTSHPDASNYRSALIAGMEQGINFAGKYTVVSVGCGTSCQVHYVVDRESGKVMDKIQSSMGADYRTDSRVFVINPPDSSINYNECSYCTPEAYVFENGRFQKLNSNPNIP